MLATGANPDTTQDRRTSLSLLAGNGFVLDPSKDKTERIDALVNAGANIISQDQYGHTTLHYAITACHFTIVRKLLSLGAHPNQTNVDDITPWLLALHITDRCCPAGLAVIGSIV